MNKELGRLYDKKKSLVDRMENKFTEIGARSSKVATEAENKLFTDIETEINSIDQEIQNIESGERIDALKRVRTGKKISGDNFEDDEYNAPMRQGEKRDSPSFSFEEQREISSNFYIQKRAEVKHGPISDWVCRNYNVSEAEQKCDVGKVLVALVSGQPIDKRTEAVLKEIRSVSGSSTLTEFLSASLWEAAISKSHLANAGLNVFMMNEPSVRFPKITQYPALEWKTEGSSSTDRTINIGSVDGEACTLRGWASITQELLQDGHNVAPAVSRAFSVAAANSIDEGGLYGSDSSGEPKGLFTLTDINRYDMQGAQIESYDPFLRGAEMILQDNGQMPDTTIMSPENWIALQLLKTDTELMPLPPPFALVNHRFWETSKVNYSEIFMGGFSNSLHLGIRLNTTIVVSPILSDTYSNNILCASRAQFFHEREQDFCIIENVQLT